MEIVVRVTTTTTSSLSVGISRPEVDDMRSTRVNNASAEVTLIDQLAHRYTASLHQHSDTLALFIVQYWLMLANGVCR
jgi:hypothetical protein